MTSQLPAATCVREDDEFVHIQSVQMTAADRSKDVFVANGSTSLPIKECCCVWDWEACAIETLGDYGSREGKC